MALALGAALGPTLVLSPHNDLFIRLHAVLRLPIGLSRNGGTRGGARMAISGSEPRG